jgi:hypothetical protein
MYANIIIINKFVFACVWCGREVLPLSFPSFVSIVKHNLPKAYCEGDFVLSAPVQLNPTPPNRNVVIHHLTLFTLLFFPFLLFTHKEIRIPSLKPARKTSSQPQSRPRALTRPRLRCLRAILIPTPNLLKPRHNIPSSIYIFNQELRSKELLLW